MSRIVIFANGTLPEIERVRDLLRSGDTVVCADGGSRYAFALGLRPAAVIGDLDSLDADERRRLEADGVAMMTYPHDKDETDLELSLRYALERQPSAILIVAALGKRLDHTLGNISILTDRRLAALDCRLDDGQEEVFFCRGASTLRGARGDLVSLIPWGISVTGIRTEGLRWPLHGETLYAEAARGISNEMLGETAQIQLENGLLLVVHHRRS